MKEKVGLIMHEVEQLKEGDKKLVVEFKILAMKNIDSAKEFVHARWNKLTNEEKLNILISLECPEGLNKGDECRKEYLMNYIYILILRGYDKDYLPM